MTKKALIVVDVQNDFCPGGSLAVSNGDQVVEPINQMLNLAKQNNWEIYFSRDWHPAKTKHFQKWPAHCVQNTRGAEFHPNLHQPYDYPKFQIISKGLGEADDYSAFDGGMRPKAKQLYVGGLATDYCVLWTVKKALELGYEVIFLSDACQAVNLKPDDGKKAIKEMRNAGVKVATTKEVINELDM
ncbi:MAG: isochorismatase family protein [Patescibacteria group bacterium]